MTDVTTHIAQKLAEIQARLAAAAKRCGRQPNDVRIVAVTKYVGLPEIEALRAAGCHDVGESRPQELWHKAESLSSLYPQERAGATAIRWHLVGHLQRNKVRRTLPLVEWIHSADSLRLLEDLNRQAGELGRRPNVLLEVNISGEPAKHGFQPDELSSVVPKLASLNHLHIRGLMGMAALEGDLDVARRNFADLRQLRERVACLAPPGISLTELSMGMSRDYEVAIEEGATLVRIGSALFE